MDDGFDDGSSDEGDQREDSREDLENREHLLRCTEIALDNRHLPMKDRCETLVRQQKQYKHHLKRVLFTSQRALFFDDFLKTFSRVLGKLHEDLQRIAGELSQCVANLEEDIQTVRKQLGFKEFVANKTIEKAMIKFEATLKITLIGFVQLISENFFTALIF